MGKRIFSVSIAAGLFASVLTFGGPASAATEVPETVQIEDPAGDANYLNDGTAFGLGGGKNNTTPADVSSFADVLAVWYTNDADTISVHVQTELPPPSSGAAYYTEIGSNFDEAGDPCVMFEYVVAAPSFQREGYATVTDVCADADPVEGELVVEEAADGTGIATVTVPRTANAAFAVGGVLVAPEARVTNATGPIPEQSPQFGGSFLIYPVIDNTEPGTDYALVDVKSKKKKRKAS